MTEQEIIMIVFRKSRNQFTGSCFRMVRIVSKNNFFEIKISQRHVWEIPALSFHDLLDRVKNSFSRCKHDQGFFKPVYTGET